MKKLMKRIGAVLMAVAMMAALGVSGAWAVDKTISLGGLESGDTVTYYKVIGWDATANNNAGAWAFQSPFNTVSDQIQKNVIGYVDNTDPQNPVLVNGKITSADAAAIASKATTSAANSGGTVDSTGTWTKDNLDPGLYMVQVVPNGKTDVVYNPVFLAVQKTDAGSELTLPATYQDSTGAKAKKSEIDVNKESSSDNGTTWGSTSSEDVGDIMDFKVVTSIPVYLENYTNPVFTVNDVLTGLSLAIGEEDALSDITVKVGNDTLTEVTEGTDAEKYASTTGDYYITNKTAAGYTVNFTKKYLLSNAAVQTVTITYQAKITDYAKSVNPTDNTVTINYSNNPADENAHGEKKDKTTHYTFSIDAGLFGNTQYENTEIVKVGVDAAGNIITTTETTYHNGETHMPLQGAKFQLFTDEACENHYTNSQITATTKFTSGANGKLLIEGLDEGTYYLKETDAANGYALLTTPVKIIIKAKYKTVPATDECNAYDELDKYAVVVGSAPDLADVTYESVTVGENASAGTTSTYEMDNGTIKLDSAGHAGDHGYEIKNVQGQNLPSTGGIGTYVFTVAGVAIMAIAAGLLIVRHKKKAE